MKGLFILQHLSCISEQLSLATNFNKFRNTWGCVKRVLHDELQVTDELLAFVLRCFICRRTYNAMKQLQILKFLHFGDLILFLWECSGT